MNTSQELKIVFTGPMGAGKTTAIRAISDTAPVSTEVGNDDNQSVAQDSSTVALDQGRLRLENGSCVHLYGTPGEARFSFLGELIGRHGARGALGVILLIDGSSPTARSDLETFIDAFRRSVAGQPFVIGVGRVPVDEPHRLEEFSRVLEGMGLAAPLYAVDVREREDVLLLIETLLCILESQSVES